jgi:hypothetical protein
MSLAEKLGVKRQSVFDKFNAEQPAGSPAAALIGKWMARRAVATAVGAGAGGVLGGPLGAFIGWRVASLVGEPATAVTQRVASVVRKVSGAARSRVVKGAAKYGTLKAASTPDVDAVKAASPQQIEQQARQAAEQAALTFGLPQAVQDQAVQRNVAGLMFLQEKGKQLQ